MKTADSSRHFGLFSTVFFVAAAILSGVLWLNNLWSALCYHAALFSGKVMTELPSGFSSCLDWSTADVSTVTTFIPFFGFLLIFYGLRRRSRHENWPFFAGYDRLNIALGLLGTLWGIILIGYYPVDRVTIPALMSCLHTAMFSTLAAIAWVMVLEPLLFRPWLNGLRRQEEGDSSGHSEEALEDELDALMTQLHGLSETLTETGRTAAGFQENLAGVNQEISREREAGTVFRRELLSSLETLAAVSAELKRSVERLAEENGELFRCNGALTEANASLSAAKEALTRENAVLSCDNSALTAAKEELTRENAALSCDNSVLTAAKEELAGRNAAISQNNTDLTAELARSQETLAKVRNQLEAVRSALR